MKKKHKSLNKGNQQKEDLDDINSKEDLDEKKHKSLNKGNQQKEDLDDINSKEDFEKTVESLESKITELNDELIATNDKFIRQIAENDNLRKRFAKEKNEIIKYSAKNLAIDLFSIADNFSRALLSAKNDVCEDNVQFNNLLIGLNMIDSELQSIFKNHGIEQIDVKIGDVFSHRYHQAMGEEESDEIKSGSITKVVFCGYKLYDRLLRAAGVIVSKG